MVNYWVYIYIILNLPSSLMVLTMPAEEGVRASPYLYKLIYIYYFNQKKVLLSLRYHVGLDSNIGWQREDAAWQNGTNKPFSGTMDFNNYSDVRYAAVKVCFLHWCIENININPSTLHVTHPFFRRTRRMAFCVSLFMFAWKETQQQ